VEWAAALSGDPLAMAAADFYRAGELIATAEWRGALDYLDTARDVIADRLRAQNDEAALAMHGVLHLKSGLAPPARATAIFLTNTLPHSKPLNTSPGAATTTDLRSTSIR